MSDEELSERIAAMEERINDICEDFKGLRHDLKDLREDVHETSGKTDACLTMITNTARNVNAIEQGQQGIKDGVDRASSVKTAIQFASIVLVPILVALIGGYFALKGAAIK